VVARWPQYVDELLAFPGHPGIPERPCGPDWAEEWAAFRREAAARSFDLALQCYGANAAANEVTAALGARRTGGFFVPGAWAPEDLETSVPYPEHLHEVDRHLHLMAHLGAPSRGGELELPVTARRRTPTAACSPRRASSRGRTRSCTPAPRPRAGAGRSSAWRRWPTAWPPAAWPSRSPASRPSARSSTACARSPAPHARPVRAHLARRRRGPRPRRAPARGQRHGYRARRGGGGDAERHGVPLGRPAPLRLPGPRRHRIARVQVECNPCPHLTCPIDHRCATRLTPERVLAEADALLRGPARAARARRGVRPRPRIGSAAVHVLRLCSVFEPPDGCPAPPGGAPGSRGRDAVAHRGAHALPRRPRRRQDVVTACRPGAARVEEVGRARASTASGCR
jgi:hypothetical protein